MYRLNSHTYSIFFSLSLSWHGSFFCFLDACVFFFFFFFWLFSMWPRGKSELKMFYSRSWIFTESFKVLSCFSIHTFRMLPYIHMQNCPCRWNGQTGGISEFNLLCNYRALSIYYLWLKLSHMWFNWHTMCSHYVRHIWQTEMMMKRTHTHTHKHERNVWSSKVIILVGCHCDHDSDCNRTECRCTRHGWKMTNHSTSRKCFWTLWEHTRFHVQISSPLHNKEFIKREQTWTEIPRWW